MALRRFEATCKKRWPSLPAVRKVNFCGAGNSRCTK